LTKKDLKAVIYSDSNSNADNLYTNKTISNQATDFVRNLLNQETKLFSFKKSKNLNSSQKVLKSGK